jgi:flagellar biogenesis protein FliO
MTDGCGGWAVWLMGKVHKAQTAKPRLALLDRITLAPRQSLALVEAEGKRMLVATSAEGGPAFYPLGETAGADGRTRTGARRASRAAAQPSRVSW